jgi:hypothetical protein
MKSLLPRGDRVHRAQVQQTTFGEYEHLTPGRQTQDDLEEEADGYILETCRDLLKIQSP